MRRLVHSGIDEVTFSIDGATAGELRDVPEARRLRTRRSGNLRAAADEKQRAARDVPFINWRYILFTHNDSDAEMQLARTMAAEMGVDRLCWELTDHPEDMFSRRFVRGSAELGAIRHEIWDDNNLGNAIPGATPRAEINVRRPDPRTAGRRPSRSSDLPDHDRPKRLDAAVPGPGKLRPEAGAARRAVVPP